MLKSIKNKYYTFQPNEFLPIYDSGVLTNRREFHLYKLKIVALAADRAFMKMVDRAHSS